MGDIENVIKFPDNSLKFCEELEGNAYLELTAITAFLAEGYARTEEGVKAFQIDHELEDSGIVDLATFGPLIYTFDKEEAQKIIDALDKHLSTVLKRNNKHKIGDIIGGTIETILILLCFILGARDVISFLIEFFKKFILKV